jgi:glycolate oxidase iron-sulfur subunit
MRRRVGLLLGCVQRVFFQATNWATARVLAAEGCEVRVPRGQGCCGALMLHAGREAEAAEAARDLIDAFGSVPDQIVVNAAGCGSAMKQYGTLLREDPAYAAKARAFAARCVDVSELLAELEARSRRHPLPLRVVYQDACHLQHAQAIRRQPRQLLEAIPELELREAAEPDICCGSAGVYNLLEPDAGRALRDRKVKHLLAANPDVVASGNPGCLLQIASGLESAAGAVTGGGQTDAPRTMHLVELIDASIRGITVRPGRGRD